MTLLQVHHRRLPLRLWQDQPRHDEPQAVRIRGEATTNCQLPTANWLLKNMLDSIFATTGYSSGG